MTALTEFARLESGGLWRAAPNDQRREVTVSLGNATLVISDSAERPLAHWSLPAIERMNVGERPALFTPASDGTETLEISDDLMIDAMEKIRKTVNRRRYRPGLAQSRVADYDRSDCWVGGVLAARCAHPRGAKRRARC